MPAHRHPAELYLTLETSEESEAQARGGRRGLATMLTFLLLAAAPVGLAFIALDGPEPAFAARGVATSDDDADDDDDVEGNAASNSGVRTTHGDVDAEPEPAHPRA